jgi:hypothetical protein
MLKSLLFSVLVLFSGLSMATVDGHTRVYIVVQDVQSEEFFVERVPVVGCWGLNQGPQLEQLTSEYKVPVNIGCGGADQKLSDNINYLTCAKVTDSKESKDFMSFSEITVDITGCEAKNNPQFITMLRTAVKLNFPQYDRHHKISKTKEVTLKLVK